jgi:hypothetical protein
MKKYTKLAALVAALIFVATLLAACDFNRRPVEPPQAPATTESSAEETETPTPTITERTDIPADAVEIGGYMWVKLPDSPKEGDVVGYDMTYDEADSALHSPYGYSDVTVHKLSASGKMFLGMSGFVTDDNFAQQAQVVKYLAGYELGALADYYPDMELGVGMGYYDWGWQATVEVEGAEEFRATICVADIFSAPPSAQKAWRDSFNERLPKAADFSDWRGDPPPDVVETEACTMWFSTENGNGSKLNISYNAAIYDPTVHGKITHGYALLSFAYDAPEAQIITYHVDDPYTLAAQVADLLYNQEE